MSSNDPSSLYSSICIPSFQLVLALPGSPNHPAVLLNPQPSYRGATSGPDVVDIGFVNVVTPVETRLVGFIECLLTQWRHVLSDNTDKASCVSLITFNRSRALSSYQPVVFRHNTGVVKISEFLANTSLSHLSAVICVV